MSTGNQNRRIEQPIQRLDSAAAHSDSIQTKSCPSCNKEFTVDGYLDHVYENDDCYRVFIASEKKEMSKQ